MLRNRLFSHRSGGDEEVDINLTPMLDVVFIFFIITASFVNEAAIEVSLAEAQSATPHSTAIWVTIDKHGELWFEEQTIDIRALAAALQRAHPKAAQASVVVFADQASNNATLVRVLDQIRRAGFQNIAIAAELGD